MSRKVNGRRRSSAISDAFVIAPTASIKTFQVRRGESTAKLHCPVFRLTTCVDQASLTHQPPYPRIGTSMMIPLFLGMSRTDCEKNPEIAPVAPRLSMTSGPLGACRFKALQPPGGAGRSPGSGRMPVARPINCLSLSGSVITFFTGPPRGMAYGRLRHRTCCLAGRKRAAWTAAERTNHGVFEDFEAWKAPRGPGGSRMHCRDRRRPGRPGAGPGAVEGARRGGCRSGRVGGGRDRRGSAAS